ncbi:MAG: hypothetical protein KDC54_14990 [Lewinella sp.]|nr:hypothetical protein [Lewinella sp.]
MRLSVILTSLSATTLISLLLWSSACQSDPATDIRAFYFPLRQLEEGLVYEYRIPGQDSLSPDYWYYRSIATDSALYLTKAYYQDDFLPRQLSREEMVSNGIMLTDLFLFETDSTGHQQQVKAEVLSPSVFPFEVQDSTIVYLYKARFSFPSQPHVSHTFILNRRFRGFTTFQWQGEDYPAVRFSTRGVLEIRDTIQGGMEPEFSGEEIYAEGLGLVSYARSFGPEGGFRYVLQDRYPMPELIEDAEPVLK